jgi:hypothetical protein
MSDIPGVGMSDIPGGAAPAPAPAPTKRVEQPLVPTWRAKEIVCLLDTSGSMEWEAAEGATVSRHQVLGEALPALVSALEGLDSAAAEEQAAVGDAAGGLLIHGFADGHTELGDFNSSNFQGRWAGIVWGGQTNIMPAWKAAIGDFNEEFGDQAEPPVLLTLVITDGEAIDALEFSKVLEEVRADRYFAVAVVGWGEDHDKTMQSYAAAAAANPKHVVIIPFDSVTNPQEIANDLITMVGAGG